MISELAEIYYFSGIKIVLIYESVVGTNSWI